VFTDQNGQEIEIKNLRDVIAAKNLNKFDMGAHGGMIDINGINAIIASCDNLGDVSISGCYVDNNGLGRNLEIRNRPNLVRLNLSGSSLGHSIIESCENLQTIIVDNCENMGEIRVCDCSKLENLDLSRNRHLRGISIKNCARLEALNLSSAINLMNISLTECAEFHSLELPASGKSVRVIKTTGCNKLKHIDSTRCADERYVETDSPEIAKLRPTSQLNVEEVGIQKFMHEEFGTDFDRFNAAASDINPSDIELSGWGGRFRALTSFTRAHHAQRENVFNHKALHTSPEHSIYVRHREKINAEDWFAASIEAGDCICRSDYSQITAGKRSYYLTCSPNEGGCVGVGRIFFEAYTAELAAQTTPKPGLIVDLHTGADYLTKDPPDRLTGLETVGDVSLQDGIHIKIRKAKINGQEFYHARVHNWPDMAALPPELISLINAQIEKLCEEQGIQKVTIHCNGGLGRAPTMMYANAVERAAQKANAQGLGCCCDWIHQTSPMANGKVNLAYVMRNMMLTGHAIRSTCGQSAEQFKFYKAFTEEMAKRYANSVGP
jgi:hypothetical protein